MTDYLGKTVIIHGVKHICIAARENDLLMLEMDDDLRRLVLRNAGADELRAQALKSGLITMQSAGFAKAAQGITTVEEVLRVCAM